MKMEEKEKPNEPTGMSKAIWRSVGVMVGLCLAVVANEFGNRYAITNVRNMRRIRDAKQVTLVDFERLTNDNRYLEGRVAFRKSETSDGKSLDFLVLDKDKEYYALIPAKRITENRFYTIITTHTETKEYFEIKK